MSLDISLHEGSADGPELYSANITHNLGRMADEAGIYQALWRPEEQGWTRAADLIPHLTAGLSSLLTEPERFEALNAANGWGKREHFIPFVNGVLQACREHPDAIIDVSR